MGKKIIAVNAGPRKGWNMDTLIMEKSKYWNIATNFQVFSPVNSHFSVQYKTGTSALAVPVCRKLMDSYCFKIPIGRSAYPR